MIIKSPIDLELTQISGQTSQPPWEKIDDSYKQAILINNKPVLVNVKQSGEFLEFNYQGDISQNEVISSLNYIFDLDFNLDKFHKYLANHEELCQMSDFCSGLRLFLAPNPFECIISSICSANNSIKRWTKSISEIKHNWGNSYNEFYTFPEVSSFQNIFLDDEEEAQEAIKEGIQKAEKEEKTVTDEIAMAYKEGGKIS